VKKTTGCYPRLRADAKGGSAVGQAGGVLLTSTIRAAGPDVGPSAALAPWRPANAVHDPATVPTTPPDPRTWNPRPPRRHRGPLSHPPARITLKRRRGRPLCRPQPPDERSGLGRDGESLEPALEG